jgi:hypothetical protein
MMSYGGNTKKFWIGLSAVWVWSFWGGWNTDHIHRKSKRRRGGDYASDKASGAGYRGGDRNGEKFLALYRNPYVLKKSLQ